MRTKISRLTDIYLEGTLDKTEFTEKKNRLTEERVAIEKKLTAFERNGYNPLDPLKKRVLDGNQAEKLVFDRNLGQTKDYLTEFGSNRILASGKLVVEFTTPLNSLAEIKVAARSAGRNFLTSSEMVEAAGVEPASLANKPATTTCLVRREFSAAR
jgi:hypothetical protein